MAQGSSLFPAYTAAKTATTECDARPTLFSSPPSQTQELSETPNAVLPDWLCNASYDPALQDLLRQPGQADKEEENDSDQSRSSDNSLGSSPEAQKNQTRHRGAEPKGAENVASVGKRRFRFLLGFAGEERFFVDPKPDRSLLAFEQLPFTELAVYHQGWRCDTIMRDLPGRKRVRRYWDPKVRQRVCMVNVAKPRLSFAQSERNLTYLPIRDPLPPEPAREDTVDPLRIHDAATRSYLQGETPVGKKALLQAAPLLCPETAARQRALSEQLRQAPDDERAWLELAAFQDEYVAALEEASGVRRTLGRAKAVREKKLEVLEQGLLKTKGSVPLHLQKIQILLECGEEASAGRAWEELLRVHSDNARLWLEHARFLQAETTLSGFQVDAAARGYLRALGCFRDMLEGRRATRREPLEVETNIVEVCRQYGVFLCQCGHWERAVATFQALAELSMRCPPRLAEAPFEEALALLEPFWDSGVPRFGDEGARGWAHLLEHLGQATALDTHSTTSDDCQELEDEIVGQQPSLVDAWLRLESLRDLCQWRPYRPNLSADQVTSEDPDRMVLYEDVAPALFRLQQPTAKLQLFRAWVSLLLGVDPEKSQTGFSLAEADCFERLPGVDLRMATQFSEALDFPSGWEVRQDVADFAHEVLSQAKPHFMEPALGDELAQLALRLTRLATTWDDRKRKRCAKAWLADAGRERNLDLWTEYGLLLVDLGQPQEATAIYEKAMDKVSQDGALAECRGDIWLLLVTYLNLRLGVLHPKEEPADCALSSFSKDQVLLVLSWPESGRKFRDVMANPLQPSALLRAGAAVHARCQDPSGRTAGALGVALWTKFFVSGFPAASTLAHQWMDACTGDTTGAGLQRLHQLGMVHAAFVRVCTYQDRQSRLQKAALSRALSRALMDTPNVASFLWQWTSLAMGSLGALHVRRYLKELVQKECSPVAWLVALCFELARARALAKYRMPDAAFTLPSCRNHVRHMLEQAVQSVAHRRCPLLWRLYIELELRLGTRESARAVFYRALQCCPWAKVLYVDGVRHFPECLQEVVDMMVEKGIRLRVPLEELQLLLEHTEQQQHASPD